MKHLYIDYGGWRIHGTKGVYYAWNIARGWKRSKLLHSETIASLKNKIRQSLVKK